MSAARRRVRAEGDVRYETQRAKGEERRQRILAAALRLLAHNGSRGTTLAQIAAEAGVTQAGLLHHYGSREELLNAALDARDERGWNTPNPDDVSLDVTNLLNQLGRRFVEEPDLVGLFNVLLAENLSPDAPLHDRLLARYRETHRRIMTAIEIGQDRGEIRSDVDPNLKAAEIIGFLNGMEITWLLDPEIPLVAVFAEYTRALRETLAAISP